MGSGKGAKPPSYNLQIAVDPDSHMIVHHDLTTDATDNRQLHPMAQAAKAVLDVETLQTIADAGYAMPARRRRARPSRSSPPARRRARPTPAATSSASMCSSTTPPATA